MQIYILILLSYLTTSKSTAVSNLSKKQDYRFAFFYSQTMETGRTTTVCLLIADDYLPVEVRIKFQGNSSEYNVPIHNVKFGYSCWQMKVPQLSYYTGISFKSKIKLEIKTKYKKVKFIEENYVDIYRSDVKIYVKTDKDVYNVGDMVKISILAVGFNLKPLNNYKVRFLSIHCLYRGIAAQWENISLSTGHTQLEFQLAPDAPMGRWYIEGDKHNAFFVTVFDVRKIISPIFDVTLEGPREIYLNDEETSYFLCGKHSRNRNVNGIAIFKHSLNDEIIYMKKLKHGCAQFILTTKNLNVENDTKIMYLTGIIKEEETGQTNKIKKIIEINTDTFKYDWKLDNYIKPELPFSGKFSVTNVKNSLNSTIFELCYRFVRTEDKIVCKNFKLDSKNSIEFTIPPLKNVSYKNQIELQISCEDFKFNSSVPTLTYWQSPERRALKIENRQEKVYNCESNLKFNVLYSTETLIKGKVIEFKYMLLSRGEILTVGTVKHKVAKQNITVAYPNIISDENSHTHEEVIAADRFQFKIKLNKKIYKKSTLLVYYVYENQIISDYIDINITSCPENKVEVGWSNNISTSDEKLSFEINTTKDSVCFFAFSDNLKNYELTDFGKLLDFREAVYDYKLNCIPPNKRQDRKYRWASQLFDSQSVFEENKLSTISDIQFIFKTCTDRIRTEEPDEFEVPPEDENTNLTQPIHDVQVPATQSLGSKTWLWDSVLKNGKSIIHKDNPSTTTDWLGKVLCISPNKGIGISKPINIKATRSVLVDIKLPHSITKNEEILHLKIYMYNYLNTTLPVRITLFKSSEYIFMNKKQKLKFTTCLKDSNGVFYIYPIKAIKEGVINIKLQAEINPSYKGSCTTSKAVAKRTEIIHKQLMVKPPGFPHELVYSALLCANDHAANNIHWKLNLPQHIVPQTANVKIQINSNILGPLVQDMNNLQALPTSTAYQTISILMSNLHALKYLENSLNEGVTKKLIKNLEIGYQQLLNYCRYEKSFSLFGDHDIYGSTYLTILAIRTLMQVRKYTFVDNNIIEGCIQWVYSKQLENGCFSSPQLVFQEMNATITTTAQFVINFVKSDIDVNKTILSKAKQCILKDNASDKHILAVTSYALQLLNSKHDAQKRFNKLMKLSKIENGLRWWTDSKDTLSNSVEITSYGLLSLMHGNMKKKLNIAASIVKWLCNKMNYKGGFSHAIETIIATEALSHYTKLSRKQKPNLTIKVTTNLKSFNFAIKEDDSTKSTTTPVAFPPNYIKANVEGKGCAFIQATVNYFLEESINSNNFNLDIELSCSNTSFASELTICLSYKLKGLVNMAILDIQMPSGYTPIENSLFNLTNPYNTDTYEVLKKYEQIKNHLLFYFVSLTQEEFCFSFAIEQNIEVKNVSTTLKLYNYFKPEVFTTKNFKIQKCQPELLEDI